MNVEIVTPADKPQLASALNRVIANIETLQRTGDPALHKAMTFLMRYGGGRRTTFGAHVRGETLIANDNADPRIYSRDPEEIKAFWRGEPAR